jgi:hypothetical protein
MRPETLGKTIVRPLRRVAESHSREKRQRLLATGDRVSSPGLPSYFTIPQAD